MPKHPQLEAVGLFQKAEHPSEGPIRYVRPPTKFAETPASVRAPAPHLGEHSRDILTEVGYGGNEIDALISEGAVMQYQKRT